MSSEPQRSTLDTNVVIYAFSSDVRKAAIARRHLAEAAFVSVQLLNEFANVVVRKQGVSWREATAKVEDIRLGVPEVLPIRADHNREALRIGERYRLGFYDSLMLAVALAGGAGVIYSEDMQHDLVIDGTLRIVDPFR